MLLNGKTFTQLLNPYTMISRSLKNSKSADQTIDTIYLSLFSRKASRNTRIAFGPYICIGAMVVVLFGV